MPKNQESSNKSVVKKKAAPKKTRKPREVLSNPKEGNISKSTIKKAVKKVAEKKPKKPKNYLNNADLMIAVKESKQRGEMTPRLAHMLQTLCARYGRKGSYAGYSYNEDMQAYAMMMLVHTWSNFNPERSKNPFAFYTQCIKNSFNQYLNKEKRHRLVRDEMLLHNGLNPSYNYQLEYEEKMHNQDDDTHGNSNDINQTNDTVTTDENSDLIEF